MDAKTLVATAYAMPLRENGGKTGTAGKRGQTTFSTFYRIALMLKKVVCPRFRSPRFRTFSQQRRARRQHQERLRHRVPEPVRRC
jgi:hypothetical protein